MSHRLLFVSLVLMLATQCGRSAEPELVIAIAPDIPPYVMDGATSGLEVEIVRRALAGSGLSPAPARDKLVPSGSAGPPARTVHRRPS